VSGVYDLATGKVTLSRWRISVPKRPVPGWRGRGRDDIAELRQPQLRVAHRLDPVIQHESSDLGCVEIVDHIGLRGFLDLALKALWADHKKHFLVSSTEFLLDNAGK
jgi:hypothetical protein